MRKLPPPLTVLTSAGTTGDSTINASADTESGAQAHGGTGKNAITGGKGDDAILGNAQDDVLSGGEGDDVTVTGDGRDIVGKGQDVIVMGKKFDGFDSIDGGTGQDVGVVELDTLQFTDNGTGTDDLNKIKNIEAIELGDADANITLAKDVVAATKSLSVSFENEASSNKLTFNGKEAAGTLELVGAKGADKIEGGSKMTPSLAELATTR